MPWWVDLSYFLLKKKGVIFVRVVPSHYLRSITSYLVLKSIVIKPGPAWQVDLVDSMAGSVRVCQKTGLCNNQTRFTQRVDPWPGQTQVTLHGRFEILSLSGSFSPPPAPLGTTSLTIFLTWGTRSGDLRSNFKIFEKGFSKDHKRTHNPLWRHIYETAETWLEAHCSCIQA